MKRALFAVLPMPPHCSAAVVAIALLSLSLSLAGTAWADDEGSEHTAVLVGDPDDTIGIVMRFDAELGWSMDYRAKPGAATVLLALPFLPADHAHYAVVVGPKRRTITFVMTSRAEVTAETGAIWVMNAAGEVTQHWTMGDLLTATEIGALGRSISHVWWLEGGPRLQGRLVTLVLANGGTRTIDPASGVIRR